MIVATAGHVDHGKTSLVRALTGVDTDRLAEEKRRGLSIDVGFAYAELGDDRLLGFVDVPGHERFLRNMLAGVAAVDYALLVVAADDGPMPQTREHLAILDLLGVVRGAVAVTKTDRVPERRVLEVKAAITGLLESTGLRGADLFSLSATTGEGVGPLRAHLLAAAERLPARAAGGCFRLAVDRSFTLDGVGRVVTGAVLSGSARPDDALVVSPDGIRVRLRGIHAHNRPADVALAGQRCALNLAGTGLDSDSVLRGSWVVSPSAHAPTGRFDAHLRVRATEARPLAHWTPVHVHVGAASMTGRVAPLESRAIEPGAAGLAQIVLERPAQLAHGDRFIVRDQSARRTIGGGTVVDPFGAGRGRGRPARLQQLAAMIAPDTPAALAALLEVSPGGVRLERFARTYNLTAEELSALRERLRPIVVKGPDGELAMGPEHWQRLQRRLCATLEAWHAEHPESRGMPDAVLSQRVGRDIPDAAVRAAARACVEAGEIEREGFGLRLAGHEPVLSGADAALLQRFASMQDEEGLRPPNVGALAEATGLERQALIDSLERLARLGHLERLGRNRYLTPEAVVELARIAMELAAESPDGSFDAATYRDRSGIGRNHTVKVLEHLDRLGVTRFAGGRRSLWPWTRGDVPNMYATR